MMQALIKHPYGGWTRAWVKNSRRRLREILTGKYAVWDMNGRYAVLYNPRGRDKGLPYNTSCRTMGMDFYGAVIVVGLDSNMLVDLPEKAYEVLDGTEGHGHD